MITQLDFLKMVIDTWEGLWSNKAADAGNWATRPDGTRMLVGTMRGVTVEAFAEHHGIPAWQVTPAMLQAVTLDDAAEIGLQDYIHAAHFDLLAWGPATAALDDFGWGAGMGQAARSLQRLIGVTVDASVGPITAHAYGNWVQRLGWECATLAVHDMRADFYREVVAAHPEDAQFLQGWLNRANWASASNIEFWSKFSA